MLSHAYVISAPKGVSHVFVIVWHPQEKQEKLLKESKEQKEMQRQQQKQREIEQKAGEKYREWLRRKNLEKMESERRAKVGSFTVALCIQRCIQDSKQIKISEMFCWFALYIRVQLLEEIDILAIC